MTWIFVLLLLASDVKVPDAEQLVGPAAGQPVSGALLDQRTNETAGMLRCPVCQGMSIADSPSEMAVNMKGQVRELLARGYTQEQILSFFERSYGQFVLLKPKFNGVSAAVWILPLLAVAIGVVVVFSKAKKLERPVEKPAATVEDPYLTRVREMVKKS